MAQRTTAITFGVVVRPCTYTARMNVAAESLAIGVLHCGSEQTNASMRLEKLLPSCRMTVRPTVAKMSSIVGCPDGSGAGAGVLAAASAITRNIVGRRSGRCPHALSNTPLHFPGRAGTAPGGGGHRAAGAVRRAVGVP